MPRTPQSFHAAERGSLRAPPEQSHDSRPVNQKKTACLDNASGPHHRPIRHRIRGMRNLLSTMTAAVLLLVLPAGLSAQQRVSPHESTSITVDGHKITITYGRPSLKGRKMLGAHEPYGKVWRTGADEATTIETDADLDINGLKVPKGKYAMFTIPGENEWKL